MYLPGGSAPQKAEGERKQFGFLFKGIVPEEIRVRKKSPYPKTHNPAYMRAVSNLLRQVLDEGTSPMFDFIRRDALEQLLTETRAQPWYGQLMQTPQTIAYFLQLHHWMRLYHVTIG